MRRSRKRPAIAEAGDAPAQPTRFRREWIVEILEAIVLAVVAIATAWSGYEAARWHGRQAELYGEDAAIRIRADQLLTLGGQQRLLDVTTFNTWIEARFEGRMKLAALYERRFSPEYKVAFDAWLANRSLLEPGRAAGAELHARIRQCRDSARLGVERTRHACLR